MSEQTKKGTILEPAREIDVWAEADVVVVGGGPGGHSAAVAAARNGAKTILIERYGHLGGMASGGLVLLIPHCSDGTEEQQIAGICQEWFDRLDVRGGVLCPKKEELGSTDKETIERWRNVSPMNICEGHVQLSAWVDPELTKCILNDMVEEAGVKLLLHAWGTRSIVEKDHVQGVIFESKAGRQAIMGKVIIDGTGDGDLLPSAGADFDRNINSRLRISTFAVVFRIGNVDKKKLGEFRSENPQKFSELMKELMQLGGYPSIQPTPIETVIWVNNRVPNRDVLNPEDLTFAEVDVRKRMLVTIDFLNKYMPGFENSFIHDTAPQLGTRGSRRLIGEHMVNEEDMRTGRIFDDTIVVCPNHHHVVSQEHPHVHIPYRSIVPEKIEGLLVAGRSFSSEDIVNEDYNLIPHCIAIGEAAGTAAAIAVKENISLRKVNYQALQQQLVKQGAHLPKEITDKL